MFSVEKLIKAKKEKGFTYLDIADLSGIPRQTILSIFHKLSNSRSITITPKLIKIATILEVSILELLKEDHPETLIQIAITKSLFSDSNKE